MPVVFRCSNCRKVLAVIATCVRIDHVAVPPRCKCGREVKGEIVSYSVVPLEEVAVAKRGRKDNPI
jgi:phage FluMu protein Com